MSRRRPKGELQFGSDSFLDVVANIVGILIILIVIAGLRVGQLPVVKPHSITAVEPVVLTEDPISTPEIETSNVIAKAATEDPSPSPVIKERLPLPPLVAPEDLVQLSSRLESEMTSLRDQERQIEGELNQATELQNVLLERQETIRDIMDHKSEEAVTKRKQAAAFVADIDLARETLARLKNQLEEIDAIPAKVEKLEHKITPISRVVNGNEKHYRLEHNRIAEVPIEDMIARLREQIDRRRDWLAKTRQYHGQIGPIRGFNMQYQVRVDPMSDLDAAKSGHGGFRVSLSSWEIHPESELMGETAEVALRKGSQFYSSIIGTSSDTTLTFWVYPDSYAAYRKLQKFAHQHGYTVAGRPLPQGVPIAGSPHGSRSSGQ